MKKIPLLYKYFLSYLSVILIFLFIALALENLFISTLKDNFKETTMNDLTKTVETLSIRMDELDQITYAISRNNVFIGLDLEETTDIEIYEFLYYDIKHYYVNSNIIEDVFIWKDTSESSIIYNSYFRIDSIPLAYEVNNSYIVDFFKESAQVTSTSNLMPATISWFSEDKEKLLYFTRYTVDSENVYIYVVLDEDEIANLFEFTQINSGGAFSVINSSDQVIYNKNVDFESISLQYDDCLDGANISETDNSVLFTYKTSENLMYILEISNAYFAGEAKQYTNTIFFMIIISFLACVTISIIYAFHNTKPIKAISRTLGIDKTKDGSEYLKINNHITALQNDKAALEHRIDEYNSLRKNEIFSRLLRNEIFTQRKLDSMMGSLDITISHPMHTAVYISLMEKSEDTVDGLPNFLVLKEELKKEISSYYYTYPLTNRSCVVFCGLDSESDIEMLQNKFRKIADTFVKNYQMDFVCGIGIPVDSLINIERSFTSSKVALESYTMLENKKIFIANQENMNSTIEINAEIEKRLLALVSQGDFAGVSESINNYFANYRRVHFIDKFELEKIIKHLQNINSKIAKKQGFLPKLNTFERDKLPNFNELKNISIYHFGELSNIVASHKNKERDKLYSKIIAFLNTNYFDYDLSLASLSDEFDLSEKYISRFIKEYCGVTFVSILEDIRMKNVIELMKNEKNSITNIANKCGYSNHNSFYKAFKRKYGVSPGEYRNSLKEKH